MLDQVIEDFGEMPEFLKNGMRIKYQVRDRQVLKRFCEKYCIKLVMVGMADEPKQDELEYNPNAGFEPLYFFEGNAIGHTKEQLEISLQDTEVIMR